MFDKLNCFLLGLGVSEMIQLNLLNRLALDLSFEEFKARFEASGKNY